MAKLLVLAQDAPVPDSPGKWLAGHVIGVFEDSHVFGKAEVPPKFWVLWLKGIPVDQLSDWVLAHKDSLGNILGQRSSKLDTTKLSAAEKIVLNKGMVTISASRLGVLKKSLVS